MEKRKLGKFLGVCGHVSDRWKTCNGFLKLKLETVNVLLAMVTWKQRMEIVKSPKELPFSVPRASHRNIAFGCSGGFWNVQQFAQIFLCKLALKASQKFLTGGNHSKGLIFFF